VAVRSKTPLLRVPAEATDASSFRSRVRDPERPRLFFPETLAGCTATGRKVRVRLESRLFPAPNDLLLRDFDLLRERDDPRLLDLDRRLALSGSMLSSSSDPFFLRFFSPLPGEITEEETKITLPTPPLLSGPGKEDRNG